jgi:methylation protein EvaC
MKKQFLHLGKQPLANGFLYENQIDTEFFYELKVGFDDDTKLVTHMEYVNPPLMFNDNYAYRGSMSKTMREHFSNFSDRIKTSDNLKILEIGSNDGVFLKNWNTKNVIAVEPCGNFAKLTNELGYTTYNEFWTTSLASEIKSKHGELDIIFAANCICHIPDLDDTFKAVESLLTEGGVFIFEDPSLAKMINSNSYDQIYDEHPHIFSVIALDNILKRNGLQISKVENISVHGGSNRIYAKKIGCIVDGSVEKNKSYERILGLDKYETFVRFSEKVKQSKDDLIRILNKCKEEGKKVISYGATSKSTTIFNYCGIDKELIQYITDTTPEKQNKLSPGVHIPIVSPESGFDNSVDFAFLGAWNFVKEISEKESDYIQNGGKFITHVPSLQVI